MDSNENFTSVLTSRILQDGCRTMGSDKYLDVDELSARTGFSRATIWRLKRAGKIPFIQPGGKGTIVKFRADALEGPVGSPLEPNTDSGEARLPGRKPAWQNNHLS